MTEDSIKKPKVALGSAQKELDKAQEQFDQYEKNIKDLTLDRMNAAPMEESEMQTKLSSRQIADAKDIYLKPFKTIQSREKFNEKFREEYNFAKEYVYIIAENKEIIGETIEKWTKPFPGMPAEFWQIPVNKPIWVPRYVAEELKRCFYHRLRTEDVGTSSDGVGKYYGTMVVDTTIPRLDAHPVTKRKSIFMGASSF